MFPKNKPLRQCWKFVPTPCALADIKAGDFFKLDKRDEDDTIDPSQLFIAINNSIPKEDGELGSEIFACPMVSLDEVAKV